MAALAAALDIPPVLANLLVQRGIETEEEAWQFFNPKLENLHDPFLMKDMDAPSNGSTKPSNETSRSWSTAITT